MLSVITMPSCACALQIKPHFFAAGLTTGAQLLSERLFGNHLPPPDSCHNVQEKQGCIRGIMANILQRPIAFSRQRKQKRKNSAIETLFQKTDHGGPKMKTNRTYREHDLYQTIHAMSKRDCHFIQDYGNKHASLRACFSGLSSANYAASG
jgi:hypothetical protein